MVSRKVLRLGGSLVISLPSTWTRALHLSPGDSVELVERGESLVASPPTISRELKVDAKGFDFTEYYSVMEGAYLSGAQKITLSNLAVKKLHLEDWPGFELVEQKKSRASIEFLGTPESVGAAAQRFASLAAGAARDALEETNGKNSQGLESFGERRSSLKRGFKSLVRAMCYQGASLPSSLSRLRHYSSMEKALDSFIAACESLGESKGNDKAVAALQLCAESIIIATGKNDLRKARENLERVQKLSQLVGLCELRKALQDCAHHCFEAASSRLAFERAGKGL